MGKPEEPSANVKEHYGKLAIQLQNENNAPCCTADCCQPEVASEASTQPTEPRSLSLGCDLRLLDVADPQAGEIVLDLGSGPGHDTRKLADRVGPTGEVIGIDFGEEMIELARQRSVGYSNISYLQADITDIPLEEGIADLIVSNCVFNLIPDRSAAFKEVFRLLQPGGRLVISDMITNLTGHSPAGEEYCACIGGATSIEEYTQMMQQLGFVDIHTKTEYNAEYGSAGNMIPYSSVLFQGRKPKSHS